ncbi:MAG: zinc-binding dehydrogenase, partial [Pseudomonadota bacterium]
DYNAEPDLPASIHRACPQGVDVFIDNTAGAIHEAAMQNLAAHARIVLVGSISLAGKFGQPDIGQRFHRQTLMARATIRGFLVSDYLPRYDEARDKLTSWYSAGLLKSKFDIEHGIENMPKAFLRLLSSQNIGKQMVQVGDDPTQTRS